MIPTTNRRVLLAGATGAIGRRLMPLLVRSGYDVFGTTRAAAKEPELRAAGVEPLVLDVFDSAALTEAVARLRPSCIVHQLTDLPPGLDPARMAVAVVGNARVRTEGTSNLVAAALAAGVRRMVAQSIAWAYAPGPMPFREEDPLDVASRGSRAISVGGVVALERLVLRSPPLEGVVLRYGNLYGPGTGRDSPGPSPMPLHVDAAAWAALLAIEAARSGIFNVAEPGPQLDTDKARDQLGWDAAWRLQEEPGSHGPGP